MPIKISEEKPEEEEDFNLKYWGRGVFGNPFPTCCGYLMLEIKKTNSPSNFVCTKCGRQK